MDARSQCHLSAGLFFIGQHGFDCICIERPVFHLYILFFHRCRSLRHDRSYLSLVLQISRIVCNFLLPVYSHAIGIFVGKLCTTFNLVVTLVGEIGDFVGIEIALVRSIIINPIVQCPPLFIGQFYVGMSFFKDTDQFTGVCMIFVRLQNSHVGFRALAVNIRVQIQIRRAVAVFIFLSGTKVECFFTVVAGDTGTVEDRLYFQVESERANATFGCFDGMSGTLRSNHAFGYGDLVLVFVASDTGYDLTRLSGQPATHPLYSHSILIQGLDRNRSIGRNFKNNRAVFLHRYGTQHTFNIPTRLDTMPVMVRLCLDISILISV